MQELERHREDAFGEALRPEIPDLGAEGGERDDGFRSAERYWTVVAETEVNSLEEYTEMSRKSMERKVDIVRRASSVPNERRV